MHRNVANVVVPSDLNVVSVIQFGVEHVRVRHIIVCGHYGCSGVEAAFREEKLGVADNWLMHVREVKEANEEELARIEDAEARLRRLCELNVIAQVQNVARTTPVQEAWRLGQELSVHGWIYGLKNGLIKDLGVSVASRSEATQMRRKPRADA